jgi:hypothetical protein
MVGGRKGFAVGGGLRNVRFLLMDPVLHNLRLLELVAIVRENQKFYDDFVVFLHEEGYASLLEFIQETDDQRAMHTITRYLTRPSEVYLYDGLLRPYANSKAKWYFLAWLLRDAATQRLEPLLKYMPGRNGVEKKAHLLNEVRKFVEPLFPDASSWEWAAISETMLGRLEGSRRALKGTLFEEMVRRNLREVIANNQLPLNVSDRQVRISNETYDIQVAGKQGTLLLPIKTRETMGGGHTLLFTRDIYKSILVAIESGYRCVPILIAESWTGDLEDLRSELYLYIPMNPNQVAQLEPLLVEKLQLLLPLLSEIA